MHVCLCVHACKHVHSHACVYEHTNIHAYIHTYIHTYTTVRKQFVGAWRLRPPSCCMLGPFLPFYHWRTVSALNTNIQTYMQEEIHTHTHTYMHIHTHIHAAKRASKYIYTYYICMHMYFIRKCTYIKP